VRRCFCGSAAIGCANRAGLSVHLKAIEWISGFHLNSLSQEHRYPCRPNARVLFRPGRIALRTPATRPCPKVTIAARAGCRSPCFISRAPPCREIIDNIVKPVLDALCKHIYYDDRQVERVWVQKFEPGRPIPFVTPSDALAGAIQGRRPALYVRLSDDPTEGLS